jgi:hypothetical protein
MQKCNHCGWNISDDTPVCPYCGSPVESADEERRRRFMLRWHLNALLLPMQELSPGFLLSPAPPFSRVRGRSAGTLLVTLASVLTLAVLIAGFFAFQQESTGYAPLLPTLTPGGPVVPGGPLSIHGSNFSSGGSVTITFDGHPATLAIAASSQQASQRVYTAASLLAYTAGQRSAGAIPVKSDGTFDATIVIDAKWSIGSAHKLIATEESNGLTASLALVVPQPATLLECSKSTNSTTLVLGPVDEGQKQVVSATFKLCTIGSGTVNWTASWNQQQASWLQLDSSGQLLAPLSKQLTVTASSSGLKAGMYSTTVTFRSQGSNVKVFLKVTLIIRAHIGTCVNTNPQSLTFTATQGKDDPAPQTVTITNCGHNGSWTASTHSDDGANWLHISPTGGNLKSKATQAVTMRASSAKLTAGTYTGLVTFKIGSSIAGVVNISLSVEPSQSCITANPQSLTFTALQGQSPPGSQVTTVVNCGNAGSWSASISTTDGANWLSVNPSQGPLDGNTSQDVSISVSSANLQVGTYTGQVIFSLGSSKQIVIVTLTVQYQQAKPCLTVSPQALAFTSTQRLGNPAPQTLTLTNCGPTDSWSAAVSTADGAQWLTVSAATGTLNSGASQAISIAVSSGNLGAGMYTGRVAFNTNAGAKAFVDVTWIMHASPACIKVNPPSLSFTAAQGNDSPQPQTVTLTNCGDTGTWTASPSDSWLTITGSASGSLDAGATDTTSIGVDITNLPQKQYTGTVTFTIKTSTGSNSAQLSVALTVTPPVPCIKVYPTSLSFSLPFSSAVARSQNQATSVSPTIPLTAQPVTLTNCGDTGTVQATKQTESGGAWLGVFIDLNPPNLSAGAQATAFISIDRTNLPPPGTYYGTVTFTITVASGKQSTAIVWVTLTVSPPPPAMQLSTTTLNFDAGCSNPPSQPITVSNVGGGTLTWTVGTPSAPWLTVSGETSATVGNPGTLTFSVNLADLGNDTYTATVDITPSNGQTQTVTVTLNVQCIIP